uniref:PROTEIN (RIBULOSE BISPHOSPHATE CARBOXYLASE) n=1 Tax=Galdieria partita TaxID=83374 RepID=UPI0000110A93|nr:Chain S, PROTEIN (RIBULOSE BISPHOSPHATE CARBOXYLASE) [Galdieria partita]1BWV_U Chain U, PROTEIN (RIBULOSE BISPHOSPHATE CARBOXYLASE) [Galdieria partita]1BWV_W Chain W, PROTEIN (RIBULOSE BISPHOSPHATE CARBOXYLASE) [Galdieria partita]1BWV_Y Chain Y, PROTEIN (RIBULOSE BISPHOSPHATE CARBOXYLASE) [Galdieria partita]
VRITQGTFSFLPDLTDEQIKKQIDYMISKKLAIGIEYTNDIHPRNAYWEIWGLPLFDVTDPAAVLFEINACRKARSNFYIKVVGFSSVRGIESTIISFIVNRPKHEPGFNLMRQEDKSRSIKYTIHSYESYKPEDERY